MSRFASVSLCILSALVINGCGDAFDKVDDTPPSNFDAKTFPSEKGQIYGAWEFQLPPNSTQQPYRMFFNRANMIGMEMICDEGEGKVRASALSAGKIEANTFTFTQDLNGSAKNDKGELCSFSWSARQSIFFVQDEVLTIQLGGTPSTFKRLW